MFNKKLKAMYNIKEETGFSKLLKTENLRNRIFQIVTLSSVDNFSGPWVERFDYFGNIISDGWAKTPRARSWLYGYDNSLKLFRKIERYSIGGTDYKDTYDYHYDKEGRLSSTDERNSADKLVGTERRTYLDNLTIIEGNLQPNYDGDIVKIHYDDFGREVKREEWKGRHKSRQVNLYYDGAGRVIGEDHIYDDDGSAHYYRTEYLPGKIVRKDFFRYLEDSANDKEDCMWDDRYGELIFEIHRTLNEKGDTIKRDIWDYLEGKAADIGDPLRITEWYDITYYDDESMLNYIKNTYRFD